jgi:hypothetical protein
LYGVIFIEIFPYDSRETPKNVPQKKSRKLKSRQVGGWVCDLANVRGGSVVFLISVPSAIGNGNGNGNEKNERGEAEEVKGTDNPALYLALVISNY